MRIASVNDALEHVKVTKENNLRFAPILASQQKSGLKARIVTGVIAGLFSVTATAYHPYSFFVLLLLACLILAIEWERLNIFKSLRFRLLGVFYLSPAFLCLIWLRTHPFNDGDNYHETAFWVFGVFLLIWTTDISAYIFGKIIKGPKLAPQISPNKTISGLAGAMICTSLMAMGLATFLPYFSSLTAGICGAIIAGIAQAGDLFESWLKRRARVKDSGSILPGHGGLFDRVDGLIAACPVYTIIIYYIMPA